MGSVRSLNLLSLRLAFRELRGGLRGFYIFVSCIALGVTAIVAVGAIADAFERGIFKRGQELLGGDIALSRIHQRASDSERKELGQYGRISEAGTTRAMVRSIDGNSQVLVELKAVDSLYPLVGQVQLQGTEKATLNDGLVAFADPILFDRLGLKPGGKIRLGKEEITLKAIIKGEPDRLSTGNTLGPRLLLSIDSFQKTGLIQPGSLIRWRYRIKMDAGIGDAQLKEVSEKINNQFSDKGFYTRNRLNPTPQITQAINRLSMFLTLVGLTVLIIGGVGVGNAVSTFIEKKRPNIATFKCLGAQNSLIFRTYLFQILIISGIGIFAGVTFGLLTPLLLGEFFGDSLPVKLSFVPEPATIMIGVFYGFLVSLLFVILPLRRSRDVRAQMLFREAVTGERGGLTWSDIVITGILGGSLIAVAILLSRTELFSIYFCAGLVVIFTVFVLYGRFIQTAAKKLPVFKSASWVIARANVAGPGSFARTIILSLGLGLSLLVTVSIIDTSLVQQLVSGLPDKAPSHFFLDIKKDQYDRFEKLVRKSAPSALLSKAPMLRGRIVRLAGVKAADIKAPPEAEWVLRGDRGITYSEVLPDNSTLVEGQWWDKNHQGENLVSFEAQLAKALGLKIGDEIVVNVLGRDVKAKIANLRTVQWQSLRINFVMVFSPNTLAGAPVNMLATLQPKDGTTIGGEGRFLHELSKQFPNITTIRVRDAIDSVSGIYENIMLEIRIAGGLTLVAGALVLAGALATAHQRRIYESAIFKSLGARKWRIIWAHIIEYLGLSLITGVLALVLGAATAWAVLSFVLNVPFVFSLSASVQAIGFSVLMVLFFGIIGSWRVLSAKTAPYLRGN